MSLEQAEQRRHERYAVSLNVEVDALDEHGELFHETGQLQDISVCGANLLTQHIGNHFIGQKVNLRIRFSSVDSQQINLKEHGMVVWISEEKGAAEQGAGAVGLCMENLAAFAKLVATL